MLVITLFFLSLSPMFQPATVVQMDLTDCAAPRHSILSALSGVPETTGRDACAEYVLSSATVISACKPRNRNSSWCQARW